MEVDAVGVERSVSLLLVRQRCSLLSAATV